MPPTSILHYLLYSIPFSSHVTPPSTELFASPTTIFSLVLLPTLFFIPSQSLFPIFWALVSTLVTEIPSLLLSISLPLLLLPELREMNFEFRWWIQDRMHSNLIRVYIQFTNCRFARLTQLYLFHEFKSIYSIYIKAEVKWTVIFFLINKMNRKKFHLIIYLFQTHLF